jgi:hypothetical protein
MRMDQKLKITLNYRESHTRGPAHWWSSRSGQTDLCIGPDLCPYQGSIPHNAPHEIVLRAKAAPTNDSVIT